MNKALISTNDGFIVLNELGKMENQMKNVYLKIQSGHVGLIIL